MSFPILYGAMAIAFNDNGIGVLSDCTSCLVSEEGNGAYELEMTYPATGIHADKINVRSIIRAENGVGNMQTFRVYSVIKTISGSLRVKCEHISYDLSGYPVLPFTATTSQSAVAGLKANSSAEHPFSFMTDIDLVGAYKVGVPTSTRACIGGADGSLLDTYGGELEFDNFVVKLHKRRGADRGFSIRYGKNMTDMVQESNCSNVYTAVCPYWADYDNVEVVVLPERIVPGAGTYNYTRIMVVDFSTNFDEKPTVEQLREATMEYIEKNGVGVPEVSIDVSFANLPGTAVELFDEVAVEFEKLGITEKAVVSKTIWDTLGERFKSVVVGSRRANVADTVANQSHAFNDISHAFNDIAKVQASQAVKGQSSADIFNRLTDNGRIQGIYIEDDKWYINAEYAKIINLITDHLLSSDGDSVLEASNAQIKFKQGDTTTIVLENRETGGVIFIEDTIGGSISRATISGRSVYFQGNGGIADQYGFGLTAEDKPWLTLPQEPVRHVSWKDNGDGTYTLIGE